MAYLCFMEEALTPKRGPRMKDPAKRKITVSLTLTPGQKQALQAQADALDITPSELIVKKLKLA